MERHNHSLEQLAQAKQAWYEKEVARKDLIAELKEQLAEANQDINMTNKHFFCCGPPSKNRLSSSPDNAIFVTRSVVTLCLRDRSTLNCV